jgi:hypothetical protein
MTDKVFFSEKAIHANEHEIRQMFIGVGKSPTPIDVCKSRFGRDLGPLFIRKVLEEVNRGTPLPILHGTMRDILAWMLAMTVASIEDPEQRIAALNKAAIDVAVLAADYSLSAKRTQGPADGAGEAIGGHA